MDMALDEIGYWLALYTIPRCGLSTVSMLLEKFANPKQILLASYEELLNVGISPILASNLQKPDWKSVELCLRWVEQSQRYILHWGSLNYPALLREISSPPLILFLLGELSLLQHQTLAIVGARKPTYTGLEIAHQLANELGDQGFVIISGLARGIDGAAHQGALLSKKGTTIGVLGSGLENIYPTCHQTLAMDILEKGGGLISEFFPYSPPKAEYFPRRNRIISGMSLGVIVIEATLRSGSLITARYALEQGREVFAVPGSIRNPLSQGCHALLKEGATLVESCVDVIQGLSFLPEQGNNWINETVSTKSYKAEDFIAKKESNVILCPNQDKDLGLILSHEVTRIKPTQQKKDLYSQQLDFCQGAAKMKQQECINIHEDCKSSGNPDKNLIAKNISRLDLQDKKLVECLGFEMTSIDILMARTGLTIDKLLARLSTLQLQGYIDVVPGGYVRK